MRTIFLWVYTGLLFFAFIGSGAAKLTGQAVMLEQFRSFEYPLWFMYVTGAIEFACAIVVLIPRYAHVGAGILACVMAGAVVSHVAHGQLTLVVPPILLLILALVVGTLRDWGRARPAGSGLGRDSSLRPSNDSTL